ncbi:MAG: hypothetical protein WAW20_05375 [Anaerolineae bacterium]
MPESSGQIVESLLPLATPKAKMSDRDGITEWLVGTPGDVKPHTAPGEDQRFGSLT